MGIRVVGDLIIDGCLASFYQLQARYGLHKNNFFRYLQIRDYINVPALENFEPPKFGGFFKKGSKEKHLLSQLYNSVLSSTSPSMQGIKAGWEQELST